MAEYTSITPTKIRTMTEFNQLSGDGVITFNKVFNELDKNGYTHLSGTPGITKPILNSLLSDKLITQSEHTTLEKLIDEIASIEKTLDDQRNVFISSELDKSEHLIPTLGFSTVNLSLHDVADYLDAGFIEQAEAHLIMKVLKLKKISDTPSFSLRDLDLLRDHKVVSDDYFAEIKGVFDIIENHEWFLGNKNLTKDQIVLTHDNLKALIETGQITDEQLTAYLDHINFMPKFKQLLNYKDSHQLLKLIKKN